METQKSMSSVRLLAPYDTTVSAVGSTMEATLRVDSEWARALVESGKGNKAPLDAVIAASRNRIAAAVAALYGHGSCAEPEPPAWEPSHREIL